MKTGPFCDPRVWATPPNPTECETPEEQEPEHVETPEPEELFEATEMKTYLFVDKTTTPATESTWGCAKLHFPLKNNVYTRFLAYYGSFESGVWGGYQGPSKAPRYCSKYIPPPYPEYVYCSDDIPRVIDTAWVVMLDRTTHTFVESERVKFYIDNPEEEVGDVHCAAG